MIKKISALKVRQNLGLVMNEVALRGDDYIVERAGKPLVAIVAMEKYQKLQADQKATRQALEKIWEKMKSEDPRVIEAVISEAVHSVKRS